MQIVALREAHVKSLFTLLGVADMYDTYPEPAMRIAHTDEINAVIKPTLAAQSSAHWIGELGKLGIPCAPIQTLDEVAAEPQFDHQTDFYRHSKPASTERFGASGQRQPCQRTRSAESTTSLAEPGTRQRQCAQRTGL